MAVPLHHIAVIGATGNLGPVIVDALLAHKDHFTTITAVTANNPEDPKFAELKKKGVHIRQAKFDDKASLVHAFQGVDAVVSTVGGAAFGDQILLVDAAAEAGVKRFVPSEFGGDTTHPHFASNAVFQAKVKISDHIKELAKQGKISYTLVFTGAFADWGFANGFLGYNIKTHEASIYDHGNRHFILTHLADVGKFTAASLLHHEKSHNKALHFGGFVTNQHEVLQTFEKVSGKKWTVTSSPAADLPRIAQEAQAKGDFQTYIFKTIHAAIFDGPAPYEFDNYLFPEIRPHTLEESVRSVIH